MKPKDFQSRLGVTQEPLIDADLQMISPLHTMLGTWDFMAGENVNVQGAR